VFKDILIGVDGRQGGRDAIALARQLAAPKATFTLGHICGPFYGRSAARAFPLEMADSQQMLERERELAGIDAQLFVRGPWPVGRGLHDLADDQQADLLVVGTTRHGFAGRILIGDDSRGALDDAPCAVAIAPHGYAVSPHRLQRLGVGYDGSPESEHALRIARELGAMHAGTIQAFWVVSLEEVREKRPIPAEWPDAIDELVAAHARRLAKLDGVRSVVSYGGTREDLVEAGRELDLLIVGSRGLGPARRLIHSVSRYLVGRLTCPLLVTHREIVASGVPDEVVQDSPLVPAAGG
jgi:nucleotide-binding universal stress UspA family protein